jgi:hypothetical protein
MLPTASGSAALLLRRRHCDPDDSDERVVCNCDRFRREMRSEPPRARRTMSPDNLASALSLAEIDIRLRRLIPDIPSHLFICWETPSGPVVCHYPSFFPNLPLISMAQGGGPRPSGAPRIPARAPRATRAHIWRAFPPETSGLATRPRRGLAPRRPGDWDLC